MRQFIFVCTCILLLSFSQEVDAQKLGYVDTQELIQSMPEVKEANANIETYRNQLQKKGQDMLKGLQAKYGALEQKQGRGEISPKELEVEAQQLKQEEQELLMFEQESQQKIVSKSEGLLKPLRDKIQSAIDAVAAEQGYEYIFDYSTGFVLYADQATDVGSFVKAKLGL